MTIRLLPPTTVNRIAAGEVVDERRLHARRYRFCGYSVAV